MSVFEANLPLPPRLKKDTLRVVPLGGWAKSVVT